MIEINVRIKIDTNDPREAYLQAMSMLSFSGHMFDVSDYWLANGKPIPQSIAQSIKDPLNFIKDCGRAIEHDPGLQPLLDDLRGLPGEHGKSDAMIEWAGEHGIDYRLVAFTKPEEVTQCVTPEHKVDAMSSLNKLILDGLPDGMEVVAAANKAMVHRINVLPNAGGARNIDEEISNLFECIRNSSEPFRKLDFDVGEDDGSYFNVVVWKWVEPFSVPE